MKKGLLSVISLMVIFSLVFFGLTSCDNTTIVPEKLSAPVVSLVEDLATWEANSNAERFEISLNGELSQVENNYTSKRLTDGQSLKVRAIGDGIKFTTSDWSNVVTYTVSVDHECDFTGEWKTNETFHWHECSCGKTDTKVEHSGGTATVTEKAKCEVCGVAYGDFKVPDHTHEATGEWKYNDTHHWKECSCGAPDEKVAHSGGIATCTQKPKCEVCGKEYSSVLEHQYTELKHDDKKHWYECSCGEVKPDSTENHKGGQATTLEKAKCEVCGISYGELLEDNSTTTTAPTYLGIKVSNTIPTEADALTRIRMMSARYVSLEDALKAYLNDSNNSLGDVIPDASDYVIYSQRGNIVYVQIWLNNPDQNTILSLKLNGTKYQTGSALQSFFIEDGDTYLNCVYVAITIPNDSYREITYEVTEIEYVEGSNVSQDGKAVLIDEENDTVTIGLPYEESLPIISISSVTTTASTVTFDVNVQDEDNYVALVGGWLRVVIYDNYNTIFGQQKLNIKDNSITFENLSADTSYSILVFLLGDTHDGNGVYPHILTTSFADTQSVITYKSSAEIILDEETGKYYPELSINATLSDASFTFTRIEICNYSQEVLYAAEFNGSIKVKDGILCGNDYVVKVYYENGQGFEQTHYDYAFVKSLDYPNAYYSTVYGLVDDGILAFEFSEGKYNLDNLKIKIYYEHSKEYIAEDALYLIENPTAIADLEALMETLDMRSEEYFNAYKRRNRLEEVQELINECYSEVTAQEWLLAKEAGIYLYEFTYGTDEEFFKGANNKYYVVLPNYQTKRVDDSSWYYILTADIDENNGYEISNRELSSGWFGINPALTENDYLFVEYDSKQGRDLFYVDEDNALYLQTMSRNNLGDETHRALGYVNQIVLRTYNEFVKVLWSGDTQDTTINEAAWLESMKVALIAGDDPNSVFPLGDLKPIKFDLDDIDLSDVPAGNYYICYTYIMYGKTYTPEHQYDTDGNWIDYKVIGPLPQASINIKTTATEDYGTFEIVIPESTNNGYWHYYEIEVRNASEELIGTYNQENYGEIGPLSANYSIRIKLIADSGNDYYTDGKWSEWFVCYAAKCDTPTNITQNYTENGVSITWDWVFGSEKYMYIVNDGEEQETTDVLVDGLKDGDTIKVKSVPAIDSSYLESDYSEVYTVEDTRTSLASPIVSFESDYGRITWEAIENAERYQIYDVTNSKVYRTTSSIRCYIEIGNVYIVKAIPSDYENYCASQSEEVNTTVKLDTPEITISETGVVSFTQYNNVKCEVTYVYKINGGEEQITTNCFDVVTLNVGDTVEVMVKCSEVGYVDSEWAIAKFQLKLPVPELTVSNFTATWTEVENATKYAYVINDGEEQETTLLMVTGLSAGDRFKVSAVGDNENYLSSDYTETQTVKNKLNAPVVSVDETGLASWIFDANAPDSILIFAIMINNNSDDIIWHYSIEETTHQLSLGDTIKVKLVDESGLLEESKWSNEVEYVDTRTQITTPQISYLEGYLVVIAPAVGSISYEIAVNDINYIQNMWCEFEEIGQSIPTFEVSSGDVVYVRITAMDGTIYDTSNYITSEWAIIIIE